MAKFIKFRCLFMSFVLIICSVSILSTITAFADKVTIGYVFGTSVNVRKDASASSESVGKISNWTVTVTGSKNDTGSKQNSQTGKTYVWYNVTYSSSGKTVTGYIREDFIRVSEYTLDSSFVSQLSAFPQSYHNDLIILHSIYPNWTFKADKTALPFNESVAVQDYKFRKLVQTNYNSWISMRNGCYNWSTGLFVETDSGGWYGASREVIAYYMDPRNFLNPNDIYIYMQQSYDSSSQTLSGIEKIISGTFLDATINDVSDAYNGKKYSEVILAAASQSSVNPYILASTIIQEQGTKGTTLSGGVTYNGTKVYNFFNFSASGSNYEEIIQNGAKYAYDNGWTTQSKSIILGAQKYGNDYIKKGQDTYFYKNFNVLNGPDEAWHQYAQNVQDSLTSSRKLKTTYAEQKDVNLTFRIPVYDSLPTYASALPSQSIWRNNYYFSNISVTGLTPSFERYTFEYSLSVTGDTTVNVSLPQGARYVGASSFSLASGQNVVKLVIRSESGYDNTYVINVDSSVPATLKVTTGDGGATTPPTTTTVICGDTNGDSKVTITDLANVRLHLLRLITLKDNNRTGADTNRDGKVTITDLANIRLHLLKLITLK